MANINYTATADLKAFSTWLTNNVDQNASTWDSTTQEGVLVLNSGVTEIGKEAFRNCSALLTIELPNTIGSIGIRAFRSCTSLTNITIPNSVTTLQNSCFYQCTSLSSIDISSVTSLDSYCFYECGNLTNAVLSQNLTSIPDFLFYHCNLSSIVIPNSVTSIGKSAFSNNSSLTSIVIPSLVTSISQFAFNGCPYILSVTCKATTPPTLGSDSFIAPNDTLKVPSSALSTYQNNSSWSSAFTTIEAIPTTIHYTATADLKSFSSWCTTNVDQNASTWDNTTQEGTLVLNPGVTSIGNGAFKDCRDLLTMEIPNEITSIGDEAFYGCWYLTSITLPNSLTSISYLCFRNCIRLSSISLPNTVTNIGDNAFGYCQALTSITLPDSLISIGGSAFYHCEALNSITLPDSLISIGGEAFNECSNLASFTLPDSLESIYRTSFANTAWYNSQSNGIIYKDNWCLGYKGTRPTGEIIISNNIKCICINAFENCTGLTSVTLPNSLTTIGNNAFNGCTNLLSVTCLATTPPTLNTGNFGVSGDTLYVPSAAVSTYQNNASWSSAFTNIEAIPEIHYVATSDLKSFRTWQQNNVNQSASTWDSTTQEGVLVLNNGVTSIGSQAFYQCSALRRIIIPEGITSIESSAFQNCAQMTFIELPSTLTSINNGIWNTGELKTIYCKATTPPTLTGTNFNNVSNITLYVPSEALTIYQSDSSWNSKMTQIRSWSDDGVITYKATQDLSNYTVWLSNNIYSHTYDSTTQTGVLTLKHGVNEVGNSAFRNCTSLQELNVSGAINVLGGYVFQNCTNLVSVVLCDDILIIYRQAFDTCRNLTSINLPQNLKGIEEQVFQNCTSLPSITFLPNSLTYIYSYAFSGCTGLTSINLPQNVRSLSLNPFSGCTSLTSITIDSNNTTFTDNGNNCIIQISNNTLRVGCKNTIIPNSVTTIGQSAFVGCTGLTNITIPDSVTVIDSNAFNGCKGLTNITIPDSVTNIAYGAFQQCTNLFSVTSLATTPPTLSTNSFTVYGDTLYTPIASKSAYQSASNWSTAFTYYKGLCEISTSTDGNGTITPSTEVLEGESFTVTATPNEHYKVSHFIVDGVDVGTIDNYTFQNLDADHTVHVDFELITHTITATAYEGGAIIPSGTITVNETASQSFDIIPLEGYDILALFIDGTQIEPVETYTFTNIETDHTIDAMFYPLRVAGFNRDEMLDINFILQDYLEQLKKRD